MEQPVESKITEQDVEDGLTIVNREFLMNAIALLSHFPEKTPELNYLKTAVTTPDGGQYLVCILHVDGPKIDLRKIAKVADAAEKKEKPASETSGS